MKFGGFLSGAQETNEMIVGYRFLDAELDLGRRELILNGSPHTLSPKPFDVLRLFLGSGGTVLTKESLLEAVWAGAFVQEGSLTRVVSQLRRLLGTGRGDERYIATVSRVGYRFVPEVEPIHRNRNQPKRTVSAIMVGRERELETCDRFFDQLQEGYGRVLCVTGEPGIGKTTLMESLLNNQRDADFLFCGTARCPEPLRTDTGYLPILEVLEDLCASRDGNAKQELLKETSPNWYAETFGDPKSRIDAVGAERAKREVRAFLQKMSSDRPVALFFDDFHWADRSTLDLIIYLATHIDKMPLGLLLFYRPEELRLRRHPFSSVKLDWETKDICTEIALEPLDRNAIEAYLEAVCPRNEFPPELTDFLLYRTEGHPLFVSGVVDHLRDHEVVSRTGGSWKLVSDLEALPTSLPTTVESMIARKIERLNEDELQVLRVAALCGYEFESDVVAKGARENFSRTEDILKELSTTHQLIQLLTSDTADDVRATDYRFTHILYQQALVENTSASQRTDICAALADALVDHYSTQTEAIAYRLASLFEAAGDPWRASEHLLMAARKASARGASEEAVGHANRGLILLQDGPRSVEALRREILFTVTLATAQRDSGNDSDEVRHTFERVRELARHFEQGTRKLKAPGELRPEKLG